MNGFELCVLVMWELAGLMLIYITFVDVEKHRAITFFGITNRWGRLVMGLLFTVFPGYKLQQFLTSGNLTIYWS